MANTKITADNLAANAVTASSIADNSIGITQLNVSDGTNGQVLTTNGSGTLSFSTISGYTDSDVETYLNTSAIYTDATNDRLGVGTSSPMVTLNVHNATNPRIALTNSTTGQTFPSGLEFLLADSDAYIAQRENANLIFSTNNTERLRITSGGDSEFKGNIAFTKQDGMSISGYESLVMQINSQNNQSGRVFQVNNYTTPLFVVEQAGNVGIGTTSPASGVGSPLTLTSTSTGYVGIRFNATGSYANDWDLYASGDGAGLDIFGIFDRTNTTYRLVATNTGNVGIGTTSPSQSLDVVDSDNYQGVLIHGSNAPCLTFAQGANTTPTWRTGISGYDGTAFAISTGASVGDVVQIKSNGDFGIGTTSATSKLHVNAGTYAGYAVDLVQEGSGGGNHGLRVVSGSGSSYTAIFRANASTVFYVDGAGNYYFSGSNQSDVNKKENIADITDSALDLITQLQPKTYNFIGSDIDKAGFIAQDMEQVIPRLVTGNEFDPELTDEDGNNPTGKGIDYMGYTAYLTKAIQEQQTIIEDLKARIETLENA
jgi:hypothetical protein